MRLGIFSPIKSHLLFLLWELSVAFGLSVWLLAYFLLIYRSLLFIKEISFLGYGCECFFTTCHFSFTMPIFFPMQIVFIFL